MPLSAGRYRIRHNGSTKYVTLPSYTHGTPFTVVSRLAGNSGNTQLFDVTPTAEGYTIKSVAFPELFASVTARAADKSAVTSKKAGSAGRWVINGNEDDYYEIRIWDDAGGGNKWAVATGSTALTTNVSASADPALFEFMEQ